MNQYELWQEYYQLNGRLSEAAFMERHINVNIHVVNLMREHGRLSREVDHAVWDNGPLWPRD